MSRAWQWLQPPVLPRLSFRQLISHVSHVARGIVWRFRLLQWYIRGLPTAATQRWWQWMHWQVAHLVFVYITQYISAMYALCWCASSIVCVGRCTSRHFACIHFSWCRPCAQFVIGLSEANVKPAFVCRSVRPRVWCHALVTVLVSCASLFFQHNFMENSKYFVWRVFV